MAGTKEDDLKTRLAAKTSGVNSGLVVAQRGGSDTADNTYMLYSTIGKFPPLRMSYAQMVAFLSSAGPGGKWPS